MVLFIPSAEKNLIKYTLWWKFLIQKSIRNWLSKSRSKTWEIWYILNVNNNPFDVQL